MELLETHRSSVPWHTRPVPVLKRGMALTVMLCANTSKGDGRLGEDVTADFGTVSVGTETAALAAEPSLKGECGRKEPIDDFNHRYLEC